MALPGSSKAGVAVAIRTNARTVSTTLAPVIARLQVTVGGLDAAEHGRSRWTRFRSLAGADGWGAGREDRGVNPLRVSRPLMGVPATVPGRDREVVMIIGAVVVAVLVCACGVTLARRRRSRG